MQEHSDADDNRKECPKCFRMFMTEDSLTVHIESAHPDFDYNQYLLKVSKDKVKYLFDQRSLGRRRPSWTPGTVWVKYCI